LFKTHPETNKHSKNSTVKNSNIKNYELYNRNIYCCDICQKYYMSNQRLQEHIKICENNAKKIMVQNNLQKQVDHLNSIMNEMIIKQQIINNNI